MKTNLLLLFTLVFFQTTITYDTRLLNVFRLIQNNSEELEEHNNYSKVFFENPSGTNINVTFRVNMSGQTISQTGVKLTGSFNNWSITANPMTNIGNSIYETTITILGNQTIEYKFVNGTIFETIPTSCLFPNANRFISVANFDQILPTACFNTCTQVCVPSSNKNITFRVNMTGQVISQDGVKLAGNFNNFSTSIHPMTTNGNNIYETTLNLTSGSYVIYRFVNGTTFELVPLACGLFQTNTQDVARFILSVPSSDTVLNTICFNSCSTICSPLNTIDFSQNKLTLYPNPIKSDQEITIELTEDQNIRLFDITGKLIDEKLVKVDSPTFKLTTVSAGVYFLKSDKGTTKLIIQ